MGPRKAQLLGFGAPPSSAARISPTRGFGCLVPMKTRRTPGTLSFTRAMARMSVTGIEPVVDAAAPQHDLVVGADAGHHAQPRGPVRTGASSATPKGTTAISRSNIGSSA